MTTEAPLSQAYRETLQRIETCALRYDRQPDEIGLVAVSKRHTAEKIAELIDFGHRDFGENYLQEALEKMSYLSTISSPTKAEPIWHFIGHIQSRKCRDIAENFQWVHTVESSKVAKRLDQYRSPENRLNVLIQVNLQDEATKSGIAGGKARELAEEIMTLQGLTLRGLMIIPKPEPDFQAQRRVFRECADLLTSLTNLGPGIDQLSMGMSGDMEAAIAEGATWIRIGTAIFGLRPD